MMRKQDQARFEDHTIEFVDWKGSAESIILCNRKSGSVVTCAVPTAYRAPDADVKLLPQTHAGRLVVLWKESSSARRARHRTLEEPPPSTVRNVQKTARYDSFFVHQGVTQLEATKRNA